MQSANLKVRAYVLYLVLPFLLFSCKHKNVHNDSLLNPTLNVPMPNSTQLAAIQGINSLVVSMVTVADRNDRFVLHREVETVINNLNFDTIQDEDLISSYQSFLRFSVAQAVNDSQKALADRRCEVEMKNAIYSAIPNPTAIISGGSLGLAGVVMTALQQGTSGYMQYRAAKARASWQREETQWKLDDAAYEQLMQFREEWFGLSYRIVKAHGEVDSFRLTETDVVRYVECLKDEDTLRRVRRLRALGENNPGFVYYAPYWFQLGETYQELGDDDMAIKCYERFEKSYVRVYRKDPFYRRLILNRASIYIKRKLPVPVSDINLLRWHANQEPTYLLGLWSVCSFMGDQKGAKAALEEAIDILQSNNELARLSFQKTKSDGPNSRRIARLDDTDPGLLSLALVLSRDKDSSSQAKKVLRQMIKNESTSGYEALWLSGTMTALRELEALLPSIAAISVKINPEWGRDNVFVTVPPRFYIETQELRLAPVKTQWDDQTTNVLLPESEGFSEQNNNFIAQFQVSEEECKKSDMLRLWVDLGGNRNVSIYLTKDGQASLIRNIVSYVPSFIRVEDDLVFQINKANGQLCSVSQMSK
jgi:tetratricopeptide (TPR) repeat protein